MGIALAAAVVLGLAWAGLTLIERSLQKSLTQKKREPWHL